MSTQWYQGQIERLLKIAEEAISQFGWPMVHRRAQNILALNPVSEDFLETCLNSIETLYPQRQA